jgi:hypothetical protein
MKRIKTKGVICLVILSVLFTAISIGIPGTLCDTELITAASAEQYVLGAAVDAAIDENGDVDYYTFELTCFSNIEIFTQGSTDTFGTLMDSSGKVMMEDDDSLTGKNFILRTQLDPGIYFIKIRDYYDDKVGKYTLQSSVCAASIDTIGDTIAGASALPLNQSADSGE